MQFGPIPTTAGCGFLEDAFATDLVEGAHCHLLLAQGIESASIERAAAGAERLLDYLEAFARRVIDG